MERVGWWSAVTLIAAIACSGESTTRGDGDDDEPDGASGRATGGSATGGAAMGASGGSGGSSGAGDGGDDAPHTAGAGGDPSEAGASGDAGGHAATGAVSGGGAGGEGATGNGNGGEGGAEVGGDAGQVGTGCVGLECAVAQCENGSTTLTGRVYDPAGTHPIYNASVYVPNAELEPLPSGASCDCAGPPSGDPITTTLTGATGEFELHGVPSGENIPLVIQIGKWRRKVIVPSVPSCVSTAVGPELTRLPRSQAEGDLPQIAMVTGYSDALECLLRRVGIDDSEFTTDAGAGRVHLYAGGEPGAEGEGTIGFATGEAFAHASSLWADTTRMLSYDVIVQSCEGGRYAESKAPYYDEVAAYANAGGRLLLSHLQFDWLVERPDFVTAAEFIGVGDDLPEPIDAVVNTTTPRGSVFADWLVFTGASPVRGVLEVRQGQHSVASVNAPTEEHLYVPSNPNDDYQRRAVQALSFRTPVGAAAEAQCGRVLFSDLHMNVTYPDGTGGDNSDPDRPFPTGCDAAASPLNKALEFLFFDLTSCPVIEGDIIDPGVP